MIPGVEGPTLNTVAAVFGVASSVPFSSGVN